MKTSCLIIGAGPAGLTAAYELLKNTDIKPVVIEAEEQIGGIAGTIAYKGNRMDLGGHRFFTKVPEVLSLWQELLPAQNAPSKDEILLGSSREYPQSGADPEREDEVFLVRRRVSRIFYLQHFFSYPISVNMTTIKNLGLVNLFKVGCSYCYSMVCKRSEKSLEDFYINRFGKTLYRMFFENYTEKVWGRHPAQISPEWGAQRVKGLSIVAILKDMLQKALGQSHAVETSLIEEFNYPKYGPGQMWEILARKICEQGGQIILGQKVTAVQKSADGSFDVGVTDKSGAAQQYSCDTLLSSMAIKDFVGAYKGAIPDRVKSIAEELPYRDFITVGLLVNRLNLQNTTKMSTVGNIVPDCWIYIQEHGVKLGRLQIFNNWSPYMVKDLEHTVWLGLEYFCNEGDELWDMSEQSFVAFAIEELVKIGVIHKKEVLDSTCAKMKKAYPAYFGSYEHFDEVKSFLQSVDGLYCIGRNGQHRYNNMDHSMMTAIEAVKAMQGKVDKQSIWEVNTEQEYHEEK